MVEKVAEELKKMEKQGIIRKVDEPTDWCAGMVIVPKPNGSLRICGDFTRLNECVRRERHILPSVEHLLAGIQEPSCFPSWMPTVASIRSLWMRRHKSSQPSSHRKVDTATVAFHSASHQSQNTFRRG